MKGFVDKKLDSISNAGNFVGGFIRKFFGITSKGILALIVLLVLGFAVFVWGVFDGIKKRKNK